MVASAGAVDLNSEVLLRDVTSVVNVPSDPEGVRALLDQLLSQNGQAVWNTRGADFNAISSDVIKNLDSAERMRFLQVGLKYDLGSFSSEKKRKEFTDNGLSVTQFDSVAKMAFKTLMDELENDPDASKWRANALTLTKLGSSFMKSLPLEERFRLASIVRQNNPDFYSQETTQSFFASIGVHQNNTALASLAEDAYNNPTTEARTSRLKDGYLSASQSTRDYILGQNQSQVDDFSRQVTVREGMTWKDVVKQYTGDLRKDIQDYKKWLRYQEYKLNPSSTNFSGREKEEFAYAKAVREFSPEEIAKLSSIIKISLEQLRDILVKTPSRADIEGTIHAIDKERAVNRGINLYDEQALFNLRNTNPLVVVMEELVIPKVKELPEEGRFGKYSGSDSFWDPYDGDEIFDWSRAIGEENDRANRTRAGGGRFAIALASATKTILDGTDGDNTFQQKSMENMVWKTATAINGGKVEKDVYPVIEFVREKNAYAVTLNGRVATDNPPELDRLEEPGLLFGKNEVSPHMIFVKKYDIASELNLARHLRHGRLGANLASQLMGKALVRNGLDIPASSLIREYINSWDNAHPDSEKDENPFRIALKDALKGTIFSEPLKFVSVDAEGKAKEDSFDKGRNPLDLLTPVTNFAIDQPSVQLELVKRLRNTAMRML